MHVFSCLILTLTVLLAGSTVQAEPSPGLRSQEATFWTHWGDGQAELAGYDLEVERYGATRKGQAVTIFVTETFGHTQHVKVDRATAGPQYPVMKLNLIRDFQTGIYDYNTMLSAFVSLESAAGLSIGAPAKISFSSQEWCGHVYHQLLFEADKAYETIHSYFDREGDQSQSISLPKGTVSVDLLWHWVRGLAGPALNPGASLKVPALPGLYQARLDHQSLAIGSIVLERSKGSHNVVIPAGSFEVETFTAKLTDGAQWKFEVEVASPHRIVRWTSSHGEKATFKGSERLAYWQLSGVEGHKKLKALGIAPLP